MYLTQTYGFNLYVSWLPAYLQHEKNLHGTALGISAGLPMLLSVPADLFGGLLTDRLSSRFGLRLGRCVVGFSSLAAAGVFLYGGALAQGWLSAVLIGLAGGAGSFLLGASWSACSDIAGDHAATIGAAMNTSGQIGGILAPIVFAYLTRGGGSWAVPLYVTAGLYLLGAGCWYFVHPERSL
jgi:MFS family permease